MSLSSKEEASISMDRQQVTIKEMMQKFKI